MTSKERFDLTVNHRQPDKMVVDFGATSTSGIHVLAENLRKYYGLKNKPVRVVDPYQMLGEVDEELREIMSVDTIGAKGKSSSFGFYNHAPFKEYLTPWGQTVLVPSGFNTTIDKNGDVVRRQMSGKDKAWVMGITFDKRALLRGDPTSRTEKVDQKALISELKEDFEAMARQHLDKKVINPED